MKYYLISIFALFFLISCNPDPDIIIPNQKSYGNGLYILSPNDVHFYDLSNNDIKNNIFSLVNSSSLSNSSSLKSYSDNIFIVTKNNFHVVDAETFQEEKKIQGFSNASECEYAKNNRVYISDIDESEIKVVDLISNEVSANIKTGTNVSPTDIVLSWNRAFIANSGNDESYDSTIISIDIQDGQVYMNDFAGSIIVEKNPVSMIHDGSLYVLCNGGYNENNLNNFDESSMCIVGAGSLNLQSTIPLGLDNADNLIINKAKTKFYLTSEQGVYFLFTGSLNKTLVTDKKRPTILEINRESFQNTDTTSIIVDFLYMNDRDNENYIYKYNLFLNEFVDSIQINDKVIDIEFHNN